MAIAGCSRVPINVPEQTKALYKHLGFNDKDNDGVIEKKSASNLWTNENYKEDADINGDGKIIESEAKYYLRNLENVNPQDKSQFALTKEDLNTLTSLFMERLNKILSIKDLAAKENALSNIISKMANAGLFKEALELVQIIEDPSVNVVSLNNIAYAMAKAGFDKKEAKKIFEKALEKASDVDVVNIASAMAKAGLDKREVSKVFEKALEGEGYQTYEFLTSVASAMAKAGLDKKEVSKVFEKALEAAEGNYGNLAERDVTSAMAKAGLNKSEIIKIFGNAFEKARISAYADLTWAMVDSGIDKNKIGNIVSKIFENALEKTRQIKLSSDKAKTLDDIAYAMHAAGFEKNNISIILAEALDITLDLKEAEYYDGINSSGYGPAPRLERDARMRIVERLADTISVGGFDDVSAKELFKKALLIVRDLGVYEAIIAKMDNGQEIELKRSENNVLFEKVLKLIKTNKLPSKIHDVTIKRYADDKKDALLRVVEKISSSNLSKDSLRGLYSDAVKIAKTLKGFFGDDPDTSYGACDCAAITLKGIACAMAKSELFIDAQKVAKEIEDLNKRERAIQQIGTSIEYQGSEKLSQEALNMAEAKSFKVALSKALLIKDPDIKFSTLREISLDMARAKLHKDAIRTTNLLESAENRISVLLDIAEDISKTGSDKKEISNYIKKAIELIPSLNYDYDRQSHLETTSDTIMKCGLDKDESAELFRLCLREAKKLEHSNFDDERFKIYDHIKSKMTDSGFTKAEISKTFSNAKVNVFGEKIIDFLKTLP